LALHALSTPTPAASWAGVSHGQHMRASCSMRWSRLSMIGGPFEIDIRLQWKPP
jgi:hypothetical protein